MGELHIIGARALLRRFLVPDHLSPSQKAVLDILQPPGRFVSSGELIAELYGEDPEGGPENAVATLSIFVCQLRKKGYPIRTCYRSGYSLGRITGENIA